MKEKWLKFKEAWTGAEIGWIDLMLAIPMLTVLIFSIIKHNQ